MDPMGYAGLDHNRLTVEITAGIFHGGRYSCIKATTPRHTIKHDPTPAISMMIPHHPKTTSIQIWRIHIYDDLLSNLYRLYSSKMYSKCLSIQIYGNKTCPEVTQMWVWSASSVWVSTPLSWWPTRSRSWERQSFWCNQYQPLLFAPWLWAGYMYIYIYNYSFIYNIIFVYIYIYIPGFKFPLEFEGQISVSDSSGMWKKSNLLFFWNDRSPDHSDSNVFGAAGGRLFPKLQRGVGWKDLVLVFHRTSGVAQVQLQQINANCTTVTCGSNRYGGISCSSFVFFLLLGQHLLWYFI